MRECRKCLHSLPLSAFQVARYRKDGYSAKCKPCSAAIVAAYRKAHPEKIRQHRKKRYAKFRDQLLAETRRYRKLNYALYKITQKAWDKANAERLRAAKRVWLKTEKGRACSKRVQARFQARHPDRLKEYVKRYRQRHPEKRAYWDYLKRSRFAAIAEKEVVDRLVVAQRDKWRCHICRRRITKATLSLDHLIPITKGGAHTYRNVAACHKRCNSRRGNGRIPAQLRLH